MNLLVWGPPEIVIRILQYCNDFPQLWSIILTCKSIHSVWISNASHIIWRVGVQSIPAFNDAILVARTTKLVKDAVLSGCQPPDLFPIEQFTAPSRGIQVSELKEILGLNHLMCCLECMCQASEEWGSSDIDTANQFKELGPPESVHELRVWRERFHRGCYRVFLAGAVFSKAYHEPFSAAEGGPENFLESYMQAYQRHVDHAPVYNPWPYDFSQEEYGFLNRYTAYNLNACEAQQKDLFGLFTEWLIDDDKNRSEEEFFRCCNGYNAEEIRPLRDTMLLLAAYEHMSTKFTNGDGKLGFGREPDVPPMFPDLVRKVTVIFFGTFRVEEVTMPNLAESSAHSQLIVNPIFLAEPHVDLAPLSGQTVDICMILDTIYADSRQLNYRDGFPAPSPPLQLFTFMLRKYFGLQLQTNAFEIYADRPYKLFIESVKIFSVADTPANTYRWDCVEEYTEPVLSHGHI